MQSQGFRILGQYLWVSLKRGRGELMGPQPGMGGWGFWNQKGGIWVFDGEGSQRLGRKGYSLGSPGVCGGGMGWELMPEFKGLRQVRGKSQKPQARGCPKPTASDQVASVK